MPNIRYAFRREDGLVVSLCGNEFAWPVLDFEAIGKEGDYTQPFQYNLEKIKVLDMGIDFPLLVWTRFVPANVKNVHREFWGLKPLPVPPLPRDIPELLTRHKVRVFYCRPDETTVYILHRPWGTGPGLFHSFHKTERGYCFLGVADRIDDQLVHFPRRLVSQP